MRTIRLIASFGIFGGNRSRLRGYGRLPTGQKEGFKCAQAGEECLVLLVFNDGDLGKIITTFLGL
jgi:hypothetical protein